MTTHSDLTAEALAGEARGLGRPCELVDSAVLAHDVVVIVYAPEPYEHEGMDERAHEIRTATYIAGRAKTSSVVTTLWKP